MHGLEACLFKYSTVAAFRVYAQRGEDAPKGEVGGHALNSHGNYIVDHGKSWNCLLLFFISVGTLTESITVLNGQQPRPQELIGA